MKAVIGVMTFEKSEIAVEGGYDGLACCARLASLSATIGCKWRK